MSSKLLDAYKNLEGVIALEIAAFEARSRKMVSEFRHNTTIEEDIAKLDMIEVQIGIRIDEAKSIERNVLLGLERLALGLHVPDIQDYLAEELKKKTLGMPSLMSQESAGLS